MRRFWFDDRGTAPSESPLLGALSVLIAFAVGGVARNLGLSVDDPGTQVTLVVIAFGIPALVVTLYYTFIERD